MSLSTPPLSARQILSPRQVLSTSCPVISDRPETGSCPEKSLGVQVDSAFSNNSIGWAKKGDVFMRELQGTTCRTVSSAPLYSFKVLHNYLK